MDNDDSKMVTFRPPPGGYVLTDEEKAQLEKLAAMPDEDIDLSDIPEADDAIWKYARRPNRGEALVLPVAIEATLYRWFARSSNEPVDEINDVLRRYIAKSDAKTRKRRA